MSQYNQTLQNILKELNCGDTSFSFKHYMTTDCFRQQNDQPKQQVTKKLKKLSQVEYQKSTHEIQIDLD